MRPRYGALVRSARRSFVLALVGGVSLLAACGADQAPEVAPTTTAPVGLEADACLVRVHGRGDTGALPVERDGYVELAPTGNAVDGDGHVWLYGDDEEYTAALARITSAVEAVGCERVVLNGFSNGGGFVGRLLCRGEDLDGALRGVVLDDPVPDEGATGCAPPPSTQVAVYWTGALTAAAPGTSCASIGYVCFGDEVVGIDAYAASVGAEVQASPNTEHVWFREAPETTAWLDVGGS